MNYFYRHSQFQPFRIPDFELPFPDCRFRITVSGLPFPDSGFRIPVSGFLFPVSEFRIPGFWFGIPVSGFHVLGLHHRLSVVKFCLAPINSNLLFISNYLKITNRIFVVKLYLSIMRHTSFEPYFGF